MAGRSAKTMIAYVPGYDAAVTWKTAGNYSHVGLIWNEQTWSWEIRAKGWSPKSVSGRIKTMARKMYAGSVESVTAVARLHETTAPILHEYFGDHRVYVSGVFRDGAGWEDVDWKAGRSNLRTMAAEGITAIAVRKMFDGPKAPAADFQMTEILRSLNTRRASV